MRTMRGTRDGLAVAVSLALVLALAVAGCGSGRSAPSARVVAAAWLSALAAGDVPRVCDGLTARAASALALEFGGRSCAETISAVVRFDRSTPGRSRSILGARVLPTSTLPLSPAPQYAGAVTAAVRVQFEDPVVRGRQYVDLRLALAGGQWRIDDGVDALFTVLG